MEEIFNQTPLQFVDLNTLFDALNEKTGLSAEQFKALVENTYWLKNNLGTGSGSGSGTVDSIMSDFSTNAVQNKIIKNYVDTSIRNAIQSTWEASY